MRDSAEPVASISSTISLWMGGGKSLASLRVCTTSSAQTRHVFHANGESTSTASNRSRTTGSASRPCCAQNSSKRFSREYVEVTPQYAVTWSKLRNRHKSYRAA